MKDTDMANPKTRELPQQYASPALAEYGTLEQVLASNVSLEVKAACIELAIRARDAKKKG